MVGAADMVETIWNFNDPAKIETQVRVFVSTYMYEVVADKDLAFKEMYSTGTGYVFNANSPHFEIIVK